MVNKLSHGVACTTMVHRPTSRMMCSYLPGAHSDSKVLWVEVPSALAMAEKYDCPGLKAAAERTVALYELDFKNLLGFLTVTDRYSLHEQRKRGIIFYRGHIGTFFDRCVPYDLSSCG